MHCTIIFFILGRVELCWNFSSIPEDGSDIYRFPKVHMAETHFLLENLWISGPSLGILEKNFLIDTNAKMWTEIIDFVILGRNYWSSCRVINKSQFKDRRSTICQVNSVDWVLDPWTRDHLCKNCSWSGLGKRLLATLALIILHSIYVGQLVRVLAAALVTHMCSLLRGVAYVQ